MPSDLSAWTIARNSPRSSDGAPQPRRTITARAALSDVRLADADPPED